MEPLENGGHYTETIDDMLARLVDNPEMCAVAQMPTLKIALVIRYVGGAQYEMVTHTRVGVSTATLSAQEVMDRMEAAQALEAMAAGMRARTAQAS
jgi:hypothetical protein